MIRRLLKCEGGNSMIEMAFALPVFVALLIGMVDMSRAFSMKLQLVQVAQRTIERVQRDSFDYNDIATLDAEAEAAAGSGAQATVTAWLECGSSTTKLAFSGSCSGNQAYARFVNISITRGYTPVFGTQFFPGASNGSVPIDGNAGVRIQ
jgi:Flp pilus assembly protein TadG